MDLPCLHLVLVFATFKLGQSLYEKKYGTYFCKFKKQRKGLGMPNEQICNKFSFLTVVVFSAGLQEGLISFSYRFERHRKSAGRAGKISSNLSLKAS